MVCNPEAWGCDLLCLVLFLDGQGLLRAQAMCQGGDSLLVFFYSTFHLVPDVML